MSDSINDMNIVKEDINSTKMELENVKESLSTLAETLYIQNRIQRIEWALSNINSVVENFQFKGLSTPVPQLSDSHALVRKILMAFREGAGLYLPDAVKMDEHPTADQQETKKQEFRDRISSQIKLLTGTKPVITKKDNGRYSIFYR